MRRSPRRPAKPVARPRHRHPAAHAPRRMKPTASASLLRDMASLASRIAHLEAALGLSEEAVRVIQIK